MANNISLAGGSSGSRPLDFKAVLVQVMVAVFICINLMLITTFFMNEVFYTTMRYILFAVTLLSDCALLIVSDILGICNYLGITMHIWSCAIAFSLASLCISVTPFTLTAMSMERYVAICMPLHHSKLCSIQCSLHCILIINGLSFLPITIDFSIYFASVPFSFQKVNSCSSSVFILYRWHDHMRSAVRQFYFLIMFIIIVFCYVKIMKEAKAASGESKKSTWKGLKTVILHGFQLLLCLIQLWCPFIEASVLRIDLDLYTNIRFFNYITFYLSSRCLSPLIYGLRDEKLFCALKHTLLCGLYKKNDSFDA